MNQSLTNLANRISRLLDRYGFIMFFLFVTVSLIVAVYFLNNLILRTESDDGYVSEANNINFNEDTISRVNRLKTPNEQTERVDASGRLIPFDN